MSRYVNPKNFHELVVEMNAMDFGDWVENEDNGRYIEVGSMCGGKYELYEDKEFVGCVSDVVLAAQFIAKGWNYNESVEDTARRKIREDREESISNGWIYG